MHSNGRTSCIRRVYNHVTFSGGFATVDVQLQGNITNSSAVLELPRNVTVTSSTFQISYDSDDESPELFG